MSAPEENGVAGSGLAAALKAYDSAIAQCPVRNGARHYDKCPQCFATAKGRCGLDDPHTVIEAARIAVALQSAQPSAQPTAAEDAEDLAAAEAAYADYQENGGVTLDELKAELASPDPRDAIIAELRGALEPFAKAAEGCLDDMDKDKADLWEHAVGTALTVGDLRRAQRALSPTTGRTG